MNYDDVIKIVRCEDGSHTLYRADLDEHYHSVYGAIAESRHIFIEAGFNFQTPDRSEIQILEIGFGTGLNALLTCLAAEQQNVNTNYVGIEAVKLSPAIISKLNYAELIRDAAALDRFRLIHASSWEDRVQLSSHFNLHKIESKVEAVPLPNEFFDLVYFDAFAPDVQAELWTEAIFEKLYKSMKKGAVLLTYSCKGDVKRALKSRGFEINKLPGPKGKREFLRARK